MSVVNISNKIGLYFGTFNPIHIGHLIIANHIAEHTNLREVWFVVTPHNPFKEKKTLLDDYQRLHIVSLAIEDFPKMRVSDIEFKLSQPSFTINTMAHLKDKYPENEFSLIMGQDNFASIHKWKNYQQLLANYDIYVYPRANSESTNKDCEANTRIHYTDAPIVEISSTYIRENIKNGKNIRAYLPEKVWKYLEANNFYRK